MAQSSGSLKYWPQFTAMLPQKAFLLNELRGQLAKDLQLDLIDIPQENLQYWLAEWLHENLADLDLPQLLYRVDLAITAKENPEQLAQALLEREAQKVLFRAQYSGRI